MRKLVTTLAILTTLSTASFIRAAEQRATSSATGVQMSEEAKNADRPARPLPFQGKVFRVNNTSKSFLTKTKAGKVHTFHITEKSKILKDDAPATLSDIKPDQIVRGSRIKLDENKWEVVKVIIGAKPAAAKEKDEDAE